MDVGFYISELLEQRGDISVPGLGYLIQGRVGGYYNEAEQKFYPPHNEVQFEPGLMDDDTTLTQYIAEKKNISLASSQYFTEKYINNLKEEALNNDVAMANIGWFYTKNNRLAFKPANRIANDPAFYGLPPVTATKLGEAPVHEPAPEPTSTYTAPVLIPESTAEDIVEEDETFYEEPESRNLLRVWLILITIIFLFAVAAFALYKYKPDTFNRIITWRPGFMKAKPAVSPNLTIKTKTDTTTFGNEADSAKNNPVVTDSINKTTVTTTPTTAGDAGATPAAPPVKEAVKTKNVTLTVPGPQNPGPVPDKKAPPKSRQFEIIVHQAGTMADANAVINEYKAKGIDAHIVKGAKGIKVSVGTYTTLDDAEVALGKLISSGKVTEDAYPMEIK